MSTRMRRQLLKRARVRHDCDRVGRILRLLSVSEAGWETWNLESNSSQHACDRCGL